MSAATYLDMDRVTGAPLTDGAQLKASIQDILLTPLGSRVMRRHYGSALCALLDKPDHPALHLQIISAACIALYQWEPRLTPTQITLAPAGHGGRLLTVAGQRKDTLKTLIAEVPLP